MERINRRSFMRATSLALGGACFRLPAASRELKVSLNAYSFNKLLNDAIRGRGEGTTLPKLLEFAAQNFDGWRLLQALATNRFRGQREIQRDTVALLMGG